MTDLIQKKESIRYPGLFVKKYKKKVFFDALWNTSDELLEARGHVVNDKDELVIAPFTKIFNRGENGVDIDRDDKCLYIRKVNGFMAAATYVPEYDDVIVSTTGSLDSDFVAMAEQYIGVNVKAEIRRDYKLDKVSKTWIFEIVHPDDPHIIVENAGAYLIGVRDVSDRRPYASSVEKETSLNKMAFAMNVYRPDWDVARFDKIIELSQYVEHEGFVVYSLDHEFKCLKIKTPYYLTLKAAARKKDIMSLNKQIVDEEYYELIDHLKSMGDVFNNMDEQARLEYMMKFLKG